MYSFSRYMNKPAVVRNMSSRYGYDSDLQKLMSSLSDKELRILQKNPDLIDRLAEISKMDPSTATVVLEEDFGLSLDGYNGDACWIGVHDIMDSMPAWVKTTHVGWAVDSSEEFKEFYKDFLLQEVRINIWMRYTEHKKKAPAENYGMYL